ncbi:MAG: class I SAM-dependent methyltransferase [Alphaproteobacteria bacterium]|nr:class I SAM-dependent methyltransferase [Alphaproteobacteria bacterium]
MSGQRETPLEAELKAQIAQDGPITIAHYMAQALGHPKHGYYMSRDPFGGRGDFITAPEVSQIFGELIGVWCAAGFQMIGAPERFALVELGPGRGTLMSDVLRAAKVMPGFLAAAEVHLVETSPLMRQNQKIKLGGAGVPVTWHESFESVPDLPLIVLANEFFDALPIRQVQKSEANWLERVVGLEGDQLSIGLAHKEAPPAFAPTEAQPGTIAEVSTIRDHIAQTIGGKIASHGGCGLVIDYGHAQSAAGDTLQAMSKHGYVDVLHQPGHCDVTSHVDFESLARGFETGGAKTYGPVPQGPFLHAMGLEVRAEKLKEKAMSRQKRLINSAVERLAGREQMGELFKVLAITHPDCPMPAPFEGLSA